MSLGEIAQDIGNNWGQYTFLVGMTAYVVTSAISKYKTDNWLPWTKRVATGAGIIGMLTLNHLVSEVLFQDHDTNQIETPVIWNLDDRTASLYLGNEANDVYYLRG